jgi:hypothetical protein
LKSNKKISRSEGTCRINQKKADQNKILETVEGTQIRKLKADQNQIKKF